MKVIFEGNETADVSAIRSVRKETIHGKLKVRVEHKTGKQKISDLAYPGAKYARRLLPKLAKTIAKELTDLSKAPDTPIEQVVDLRAWAWGYLQVKLDVNNDASVQGLARLCWYWPFGQQTPTDEELGFRTGFSADEIKEVANTDVYKQSVEALILEYYSTADKFKWLVNSYKTNMPSRFGKRMQLSEATATKIINSVAEKYDIDLSDLKGSLTPRRKVMIPNSNLEPERTIGSGKSSVYLYYYPQYRESAESKGEKIWECKIGRTRHSEADGRIKNQATGLPESPKIGLHVKTGDREKIERIIHDILKVRGKHIEDAPGTEWFMTSPSEVEEIYNFIGESSCESTLSSWS